MTTKVLELDWSKGPDTKTANENSSGGISKPTAFETIARKLRFQALGTACRDTHIDTLMMGHHQDDNVETTIWRLCTGARGAGLAGIPAVARIPECHGLYGVSGSGRVSMLNLPRAAGGGGDGLRITNGVISDVFSHNTSSRLQTNYPISSGFITICRPLLGFPKTSLLATCQEHSIPFVDDLTNFDPTITPRNAIRALRSKNRLPHALGMESILSLIGKSRVLIEESIRLSNVALEGCQILRFGVTAGWVVIRFPSSPSITSTTAMTRQRHHQVLAVTLRRVTELISPFPDNHFPLRGFEKSIDRVFPSCSSETMPDSDTGGKDKDTRQPFTLGGVMFQPLRWKASTTTTTTTNSTVDNNSGHDNGNHNNTWLLTRQPFMRYRLPTLHLEVPLPCGFQDNHDGQHHEPEETQYTQWKLWDDRFWLRVATSPKQKHSQRRQQQHETHEISKHKYKTKHLNVVIRPLQPGDLQRLRSYFPKLPKKEEHPVWNRLVENLSRDALDQSRFTIPVLAVADSGVEVDVLLALPTLGIRLPFPGSEEWQWEIHWEWMYKTVDHETLRSMGLLVDEK